MRNISFLLSFLFFQLSFDAFSREEIRTDPTLTIDAANFSAETPFMANSGSASDSRAYVISATDLLSDLTITVPIGALLSADDITYNRTLSFTSNDFATATNNSLLVYVKVAEYACSSFIGGNIVHVSEGINETLSILAEVTGEAIDANLTTEALSSTSLRIRWEDLSNGQAVAFELWRSETGECGEFTLIHSANASVTNAELYQFDDTDRSPGTEYHYKVRYQITTGPPLTSTLEAEDSEGNIYTIGFDQASGNNQNPYIIKEDSDGNQTWKQTYETTGVDGRGTLITIDQSGNIWAVFTVDGGSNADDYITKKHIESGAFSNVYLNSYGSGGGPKVSVLAQIDPSSGRIIKGTFVRAQLTNGDTNTLSITKLGVQNGNVAFEISSAAWPPGTGTGYVRYPNITNDDRIDGSFKVYYEINTDLSGAIQNFAQVPILHKLW